MVFLLFRRIRINADKWYFVRIRNAKVTSSIPVSGTIPI